MRAIQIGLFAVGAALGGVGIISLQQELAFMQIIGLLVWMAAAVALHDVVLLPVLGVLNALTVRVGRKLPTAVLRAIQVSFIIGAFVTAIVIPELIAQHRGTANPTVLPGDYANRLGLVWLALVVGTVLFGATHLITRRPVPASPIHSPRGEQSSSHVEEKTLVPSLQSDENVPPLGLGWRIASLTAVGIALLVSRRHGKTSK